MVHKILCAIEHRNGEIRKASLEALALGKQLADGMGGSLAAVVAGKDVSGVAAAAGAHGASEVHVADHDVVAAYSTEGYAAAVARAAQASGAGILLLSATALGKDLGPRVAARLGYAYLPDAVGVAVEGDKLRVTRPEYAGKVILQFAAPSSRVVLSLRPNVFPAGAPGGGAPKTIPVDVSDVSPRAKVVRFAASSQETVDVAEAEVIVAGGRGLKGPEHFPLIFDLAKALGAGVGASRAVVDAGWIDHEHQVGQTGKTVSPTLYVACGISGAIQHLAGMRTSKCIVAVNKDPDAPIFKAADYGLVGDLFEIVPKLTEAVQQVKRGS